MSGTIFETHTDERGNISVRVSREVQVLTREEADRIAAEYKRMQAENAKLRELVRDMFGGYKGAVEMLPSSYSKNVAEMAVMDISDRMRELGVEVNDG